MIIDKWLSREYDWEKLDLFILFAFKLSENLIILLLIN